MKTSHTLMVDMSNQEKWNVNPTEGNKSNTFILSFYVKDQWTKHWMSTGRPSVQLAHRTNNKRSYCNFNCNAAVFRCNNNNIHTHEGLNIYDTLNASPPFHTSAIPALKGEKMSFGQSFRIAQRSTQQTRAYQSMNMISVALRTSSEKHPQQKYDGQEKIPKKIITSFHLWNSPNQKQIS